MHTDKINSTSFQAKLAVTTRTVDNGITSATQIFKLTEFDKPFIKRCFNVCQGKDRFLQQSDKNIGATPDAKSGLKDFFRDFLSDRKGKYYISVTDNKYITGVLKMVSTEHSKEEYNRFKGTIKTISKIYTPQKRIILNDNLSVQNAFTVATVKDMKTEVTNLMDIQNKNKYHKNWIKSDYIFHATVIDNKKFEQNLYLDEYDCYRKAHYCNSSCGQIESSLKNKTPQTKYEVITNDSNEYDLEKVLDID